MNYLIGFEHYSNTNLRENKYFFWYQLIFQYPCFFSYKPLEVSTREIREFSSFRSRVASWTFRPVKMKLLRCLEASDAASHPRKTCRSQTGLVDVIIKPVMVNDIYTK